jgi:hypothetical protein
MSKPVNSQRIADREPSSAKQHDASAPPLWQTIVELGSAIPAEEWSRVPADLSANLHHYLYEDSTEGR